MQREKEREGRGELKRRERGIVERRRKYSSGWSVKKEETNSGEEGLFRKIVRWSKKRR